VKSDEEKMLAKMDNKKTARSNKLKVDSGWYTKEAMKKEGFPKQRIAAVVAYCSKKSRRATHMRRDKYERKVWEYWVDTKTTGTWEKEEKEEIVDHSLVEGKGNTLVLGGIEPGMPMDPENQLDEEDDEEEESDAGSDLEDAKPPSSNRGCKRRVKADEVEEERALEAIENVSDVLTNLLRVRTRVEGTSDKLEARKSKDPEAAKVAFLKCCTYNDKHKLHFSHEDLWRNSVLCANFRCLKSLAEHREKLITLHDELADLKSDFDGKGEPTDKQLAFI
ncbi:unnamed protein product, partial [Symbiodinium pilosum]